jgi:hypothetical protein
MQHKYGAMEDSGRRQRAYLAMLLCGLILLATAERRLAYLDFDWNSSVRLENNDKPDGDEIINRLVFIDNATEPAAPEAGDAVHAAPVPLDSCPLALITVRLSESRAPPLVLLAHA